MRIFISGFTGKRLLVPVFLLFLSGIVFALDDKDIKITEPHFTGSNSSIVDMMNSKAKEKFDEYRDSIISELGFLPKNFTNLAKGFANASVFSSDGASQRGYEGYNAFTFTFGFIGALQLPHYSILKDIMNTINSGGEGNKGSDFIKDIANVPFGYDLQALNAQFGINTSKILLEGLYIGFKFSKFDTNWIKTIPISGFSFSTMSIGVNASYQFIRQKRLFAGLLVWRGLNFGTGFIWQNTSLDIALALPLGEGLSDVKVPISDNISISMPINEVFNLDFKTNTYIVPFEAMTSIRFAWFLNLALGAGIDVAFGGSKINASGSLTGDKDKVTITGTVPQDDIRMDVAPSLKFSLAGNSSPSIFNVKAMFAAGFNLGPVIIDIPVTYYFLSNGWSLGLTFGVTL